MLKEVKKIALWGANGGMGRRYTSIIEWLGHEVLPIEFDTSFGEALHFCDEADAIIVATPTDSHVDICRGILHLEKPILCEKPVSRNIFELNRFLEELKGFSNTPFQMINQYELLYDATSTGDTVYNYYNSGGDGLYWDCINLIGLANGPIIIRDRSPYWCAKINGVSLKRGAIDGSYVNMIKNWLVCPIDNLEYIQETHLKVHGMLNEKSNHRNTSTLN
jgi:hypothetical protein